MSGVIGAMLGAIASSLQRVPWRSLSRWIAARDLPPASGEKYTIILLDLANDANGQQTEHISRSLRKLSGASVFRVTKCVSIRENGDATENFLAARNRVSEIAQRYNGDLVVWGEVVENNSVLNIRTVGTRDPLLHEESYKLDALFKLPTNFGTNLAAVLVCECLSRLITGLKSADSGLLDDLASEVGRFSVLLKDSALVTAADRDQIFFAYELGLLVLFEQTADFKWLAAAFEAQTSRPRDSIAHRTHSALTSRLWLIAAEHFSTDWLCDTAISLCQPKSGGPISFTDAIFLAWGLRLKSRAQEDAAAQELWLERAIDLYDDLAATPGITPATTVELQHLRLGARAERAQTRMDEAEIRQIAADHMSLPQPTSILAVRDLAVDCVEHGVRAHDPQMLSKARTFILGKSKDKAVSDSLLFRHTFRVLQTRCEIQLGDAAELVRCSQVLKEKVLQSATISAHRAIASAELHMREAEYREADLDQAKALLMSQVSAVAAQKFVSMKGCYHILAKYARHLQDVAEQRKLAVFARSKPSVAS